MPTQRREDDYGARLLAVLREMDDDGLLNRKEMAGALGFPNVAQVSQMLNQDVVPSGERVLRLLNADLPPEARRRVLSLVAGVVDIRAVGEALAQELAGTGAERVRLGLLAVMQAALDLLPWASRLEHYERQAQAVSQPAGGGALERALDAEWGTRVGCIRRMRQTVDGVGSVCDEMAMRPGRRGVSDGDMRAEAHTPREEAGAGLSLVGVEDDGG